MSELGKIDCLCSVDITRIESSKIGDDYHFWGVVSGEDFLLLNNSRDSMERIHLEMEFSSKYILYGINVFILRVNSPFEMTETECIIVKAGHSFLSGFLTEVLKEFDDVYELNGKSAIMVIGHDITYDGYSDLHLQATFLSDSKMKYLHFSEEKYNYRVN